MRLTTINFMDVNLTGFVPLAVTPELSLVLLSKKQAHLKKTKQSIKSSLFQPVGVINFDDNFRRFEV